MKNLLFILHCDFNKDVKNYIGGTQFHVKDLVCGLKDSFKIYVIAKNGKQLKLSYYHYHIEKNINFNLKNNNLDALFKNILIGCNIHVVHIHHIKGLSRNFFKLAKNINIPIITTLHDYYYICPNVKLYNHKNKYCETKLTEECRWCMLETCRNLMGKSQLMKWRRENLDLLNSCDLLVAPSSVGKQIYTDVFPSLKNKIIVMEHGREIPTVEIQHKTQTCGGNLNVAFLGGLSPAKGSKLVYKLICLQSKKINWFIIGGIQDIKLRLLRKQNLTKLGWYEREKLSEILSNLNIDIVCIFSMWPETYCYTVTESLINNIPVIATDMGAAGERIRQLDGGWLFPVDVKAEQILDLLVQIQRNPSICLAKVNKLRNNIFFTKDEMVQGYKQIYDSIFKCKVTGLFNF